VFETPRCLLRFEDNTIHGCEPLNDLGVFHPFERLSRIVQLPGWRDRPVPGQDAAEGLVKRLAATVSAYDDRQVRSRRLCESDAIDRCNRKVWSRPPGHTAEAVPSDATEELAPSPMLGDDRAVRRRSLGTGLHKLRTCRGAASGFQEAVFPRTLQLPDFSAACAPRRHQRAAGTRVATHTAHDDSKVHDP
jgi:hypothetical protein